MSHRVEVWAMNDEGEGANIHSWDKTTAQPRVGEWVVLPIGKKGHYVELPITRVAYDFEGCVIEVQVSEEMYKAKRAKIMQDDERVK